MKALLTLTALAGSSLLIAEQSQRYGALRGYSAAPTGHGAKPHHH